MLQNDKIFGKTVTEAVHKTGWQKTITKKQNRFQLNLMLFYWDNMGDLVETYFLWK